MFCAFGPIFDGTNGIGFSIQVLRSLDPLSAVSRAIGHVFIFCSPGLILGGIEGVGTSFHILYSEFYFRPYRGRLVQFSCFALPDPFSTIPRASSPFFMVCASEPIIRVNEGNRSSFCVLRSRTHFRRYRGRQVLFSYFALPNLPSAEPWPSVVIFMLCAHGPVFGGIEGLESIFLSWTRIRRY
jgi:hypothetical protein